MEFHWASVVAAQGNFVLLHLSNNIETHFHNPLLTMQMVNYKMIDSSYHPWVEYCHSIRLCEKYARFGSSIDPGFGLSLAKPTL